MSRQAVSCLCPLLVAAAATVAQAVPHIEESVQFDPGRLAIVAHGEAVVIRYPGGVTVEPAGAPALPAVPVWIEIPADARVVSVSATPLAVVEVATGVQVAPVAVSRRAGDPAAAVVRDADVYNASGLYPERWATLGAAGSWRGHRVASVLVRPARWDPSSGRLAMATRIRLTLEIESGGRSTMIERRRVAPAIEERFERSTARVVRRFRSLSPAMPAGAPPGGRHAPATATAPGGNASGAAGGSSPAGPGPFQPTFRPSADGSPVEYVIVTNDALASEFQRLADWKTRRGVQAVVRTVEWIDQTYPNGVDRAERVRFFIRDAYQNWGTLWVLLGGDTDVVPPRFAHFVFLGGEEIPADYYFACLDGNWNADGDGLFGEGQPAGGGGDAADLLAEVAVGRAPVSTVAQAQTFIDQLVRYEQDPPGDFKYPAGVLVLAERLFESQHGADIAEQALALLPPWFTVVRLYEESASYPGSIELDAETAIDSLNSGYGTVLHVGHGFRNTMSLGDGTITNADAENLTNDPRNSIVFAINCSSAAIDFNTIGESFVRNPNGGAIVYIGTSRLAFVTPSTALQNAWYQAVFVDSMRSVGLSLNVARLVLVPNSVLDTSFRWNLLATTLLGDPEVPIYLNDVIPMDVSHPAGFTLGSGSMTVTVTSSGAPVEGARVTLIREAEAYGLATTDAAGVAVVEFLPETAGDVALTVSRSPYRTYEATLPAVPNGGAFLHVLATAVDDDGSGSSSGDGDGLVDAGETVELTITLKNGGGSGASAVVATLTADDPAGMVTLLDDQVSYGSISAGGVDPGAGAFLVDFDPATPVAYQPVFHLDVNASQGSWQDVFVLGVRRPHLEHYDHAVDDSPPRGNGNGLIESGEEIWYTISLRNTGRDLSSGAAGTLRALAAADSQPHPLVTVIEGVSSYADIGVGEIVAGDRFEFQLDGSVDPSEVLLEVTWSDDLGPIGIELLDVIPPLAPDTLAAFGSASAVTLRWSPPDTVDVKGYDLLRSASPSGPFTRINSFTVDGSASYEDASLPPLTRFYYQVVTRDLSYNASVPSAIISGTTNPPLKMGWPISMGQASQSSVAFANTTGDEELELFSAADYVYGWHADGIEILDGDGDDRTSGVYSLLGFNAQKGFGATNAIGDLDLDGDLEIANVAWSRDSLYVWDHAGQILPGWPKWIMDDFNWPSPVFADLDGDADLEIVLWAAKGGRLFAWHHDGTEVADGDSDPSTDGVLHRIFGVSFNYSSPAVADLDADGDREIVFCVNLADDDSGGIYAVHHDGTAVAGWPFFTGEVAIPSHVTSSPAVADIDGDEDYEIVVAAERGGGKIYVLNADGTPAPGWPRTAIVAAGLARTASPVPVDLTGNGRLEIIYPASDGQLHVWDYLGNQLPGFPVTFYPGAVEGTQSTSSVADIDGDGELEILFGDETGKVHGYNRDGSQVNGFPIQLPGEVRSTPAIWDFDQDGLVEVAVQGWDAAIYQWDLEGPFNGALAPWPTFRHNSRNTGWAIQAVLPIGVADPDVGDASPTVTPVVYPPHPNPFNPRTTLAFDVPGEGARRVEVAVYDIAGRLVRRLLDAAVEAGHHELTWDGRRSSGGRAVSGVYLYRVAIDSFEATGKLVLVQ